MLTMSTCPNLVGFRLVVLDSLHHDQLFGVIVKESDYHIKKLIVMQKLESRIAGLKPTKIGRADSVTVCFDRP